MRYIRYKKDKNVYILHLIGNNRKILLVENQEI